MSTNLEGIINPPIDELLKAADSKYGLVIFGAKRHARSTRYYAQLHEGLFEYVGPLVDTKLNEKSCRSRCARSTKASSSPRRSKPQQNLRGKSEKTAC